MYPRSVAIDDGLNDLGQSNATIDCRKDKRCCCRRKVIVGIRCSFFNTEKHYQGIMHNLSSEGMYFESSVAFPIGSNIYFTLTEVPSYGSDPESRMDLRTESLAQVIWCQPVKGKKGLYGIGVKYHKPFY